ncbi:MAG: VTT domain-containing protein [Acidimicrobiales bacterium]|nr:VTT domain-containing protein [Acidimicrobiales bacterium]
MRKALVAAAVLRALLAIAAIPLAPFLYKEHVAVLILLRPTKETLLFAGFAAHNHKVALPVVVIAATPILLFGVWQFFALGRLYRREIAKRDLPGIAGRVLPRKRVKKLQNAIDAEGDKVLFLGRIAAMPSSLVAAAAGVSDMNWRRFLLIDGLGAAVSLVLMVGLGWLLEDAYEAAGPWLTALGVAAIAAVAVVIGRALGRAEGGRRVTPKAASKS